MKFPKLATYLLLIIASYNPNSCFSQKTISEKSGDIIADALPLTAFASTLIFRNGDKGTLQFVKSMGTTFVVTHGLKRLIDKPRPNGERFAFPSGHTSSAFTGAAFLQRRFGWGVGAPAYALASYVGYTRIKAKKHDIYDVTAGALLGIGSVYLFTKPFKKDNVKVALSSVGGVYTFNASIAIN